MQFRIVTCRYYRFVQAADGQFAFADALSCRLLLEHFGSWHAVPEMVEVPISEVQSFRQSLDEATRKRFKSSAHLPLGTGFQARRFAVGGGRVGVGLTFTPLPRR